ncbi:1927_t:CDS:2 [Ambispora leptoticha]|uniref:1927_t:CDS:1 n=1 Tax=Ambispora leptoticha TaxID=144679 RepID=A0A9N9GBC1_9GLOM|nr:1927_t:CDS:2 [Ambispora leptoticha]
MSFGIGQILYVIILVINGIAVLNEERFLARIGWSGQVDQGFGVDGPSLKHNIINLISAVRTLLRIPLIGVNLFVIVYEILLG